MVWQKDVSTLHQMIDQLRHSAEQLREESTLLSQELKTKSERTAIEEKNRIYSQLTSEVNDQLELLKQMLRNQTLCMEDPDFMRQICLVGTYIKRRCNLRLIEQTDHCIHVEDLNLCFQDLISELVELGVQADISWNCTQLSSLAFAISAYDLFWYLLEAENHLLSEVHCTFAEPNLFTVSSKSSSQLDRQALKQLCLRFHSELRFDDEKSCTLCLQEVKHSNEKKTASVSDDT